MKVGGDRIKARTISLAAAGLCLLFLLAGLARALLSPETEIAYENRPAKRMPAFSLADFLSGDFQAGFEDALADQLPEAIRMKKLYNIYDTALALPAVHALGRDGGYVGFRNICFFEDMLVVRPVPLAEKAARPMRERAEIITPGRRPPPGRSSMSIILRPTGIWTLRPGKRAASLTAWPKC